MLIFQLTTSQGGRLAIQAACVYQLHFNSRPHKEVDMCKKAQVFHALTFQLTTSQGGRHIKAIDDYMDNLFQLTTSQGGRQYHVRAIIWRAIFQLTTSQGGRRWRFTLYNIWRYFNSRPHKEVDTCFQVLSTHELNFNSRPHKEVDVITGIHYRTGGISTHDLTRRSTRSS